MHQKELSLTAVEQISLESLINRVMTLNMESRGIIVKK
jgi:hypothetical protein